MFCKNCGKEISNDSLFCSSCGVKVDSYCDNTIVSTTVIANKEEERKGFSIYFNDICRLEFISKAMSDRIAELEKSIVEYKKIPFIYWNYYWNHGDDGYHPNEIRFIYGYDGIDYYFYVQSKQRELDIDIPPIFRKEYYPEIDFKDKHKLTATRLAKIRKIVTKIETGFFKNKEVPWRWECDSDEFYYNYQKTVFAPSWLDVFEENYEKAQKDILPKIFSENQMQLAKCEEELKGITEELKTVREFLEKEYSLNIIPNKFRNLEAIWYICDYFDSSEESLKEILLHLDLDAIKMKLDSVIENQQQIIINQAIQISQNETLIAQNQSVLSKLSSIEQQSMITAQHTAHIAQNTATISHWTQIAANNAQACAWISVANYIK